MGFMTTLKANKAYRLHAKGEIEAARAGYEEAYTEGLNDPKLLIAYAMLLLRSGDYDRTVEVLRKADKAPGVTPDQKTQIVSHFAIAIWKQGRINRSVELVEDLFRKKRTGTLYGILGTLLIEKAAAMQVSEDPPVTAEDIQAAKNRAIAFNKEAVDYDDADSICLDNLGQAYYRLLGDKASARPFFEKALKHKPTAIDSNYFLALYDIEEGKTAQAAEKLETAASGRFSPMNYVTLEMAQKKLAEIKG